MLICRDDVFDPAKSLPRLSAFQIVVTRYNLVRASFGGGGAIEPANRQDWLKRRLEIFQSVCLPSMLSQVKRPDLWLLEFDGSSRDAVQPVLDVVRDHEWIVPAWQNIGADGKPERRPDYLGREILPRLQPSHTHVIMTRLDSDDALNVMFLEALTSYAAAVASRHRDLEDFWVLFPVGAKYWSHECRLLVYSNNPFLSSVHTIGSFLSKPKYFGDHAKVFRRGRVFLPVTREPMWMQIAHGSNVRNRPSHGLPKFASADAELARCGIPTRPELEGRSRPAWRTRLWRKIPRPARKLLRAVKLRKLRRG